MHMISALKKLIVTDIPITSGILHFYLSLISASSLIVLHTTNAEKTIHYPQPQTPSAASSTSLLKHFQRQRIAFHVVSADGSSTSSLSSLTFLAFSSFLGIFQRIELDTFLEDSREGCYIRSLRIWSICNCVSCSVVFGSESKFPSACRVVSVHSKSGPISIPDVPVYFLDSPAEPQSGPSLKNVAFYQDLSNGAVLTAMIKRENGKTFRQYEGLFTHSSGRYELLPDPGNDTQTDSGLSQDKKAEWRPETNNLCQYRIRKLNRTLNEDDGVSIKSKKYGYHGIPFSDTDEMYVKRRRKRATVDYQFTHVEISFVADNSEWEYWLTEASNDEAEGLRLLKLYLAYQMNGMDMIFSSIDVSVLGFSISIWLKEIWIARTTSDSTWTTDNIYNGDPTKVDVDAVLGSFSAWRGHESPVGWNWADPDIAMLWTRLDLVNSTGWSDLTGVAHRCGVCTNTGGTSIIKDLGYDAFLVSAHELGHNFGSGHDEDGNLCSESDQYLMAPMKANLGSLNDSLGNNPFTFSSCSLEDIAQCVNGITDGYPKTCITNVVCDNTELVPDVTYNITEQCATHYGADSTLCERLYTTGGGSIAYEDICNTFWCTNSSTPGYCQSWNNNVPAEGTDCTPSGDGSKVCYRARCVTKASNSTDREICTPSSLGLEVPDSCYEFDYELSFLDGTTSSCSTFVASYPSRCNSDAIVRNYCCFFCKANDNSIVSDCPDDYNYHITYNNVSLSCAQLAAQVPRLCLASTTNIPDFCCAACHRAGLVYQNQTATTELTTTATDPPTTTTTTVPATATNTSTTIHLTATTTTTASSPPTTTVAGYNMAWIFPLAAIITLWSL